MIARISTVVFLEKMIYEMKFMKKQTVQLDLPDVGTIFFFFLKSMYVYERY